MFSNTAFIPKNHSTRSSSNVLHARNGKYEIFFKLLGLVVSSLKDKNVFVAPRFEHFKDNRFVNQLCIGPNVFTNAQLIPRNHSELWSNYAIRSKWTMSKVAVVTFRWLNSFVCLKILEPEVFPNAKNVPRNSGRKREWREASHCFWNWTSLLTRFCPWE